MSRKYAREVSVTSLYQMNIHSDYSMETVHDYVVANLTAENDKNFAESVIEIYLANKEEVNNLISENLKNWTLDRISKVDQAILEIATTEMLFMDDIDISISINEAIELAKKFNDEEAGKFINGVLGSIGRKLKGE